MLRSLALALVGLLGAAPAHAQLACCAEVPSPLARSAELQDVLRVAAPDRSAPSHTTMGMPSHWALEVENLTDAWVRVELVRLDWVGADRRVALRRARLSFVGAAGRRHEGAAVTLPPRFRGRVDLAGRVDEVRYHALQWHEAALRVRGVELSLRGCGLWFRHGRRR